MEFSLSSQPVELQEKLILEDLLYTLLVAKENASFESKFFRGLKVDMSSERVKPMKTSYLSTTPQAFLWGERESERK